jgi:hypothetical protein
MRPPLLYAKSEAGRGHHRGHGSGTHKGTATSSSQCASVTKLTQIKAQLLLGWLTAGVDAAPILKLALILET